MEEDSASGPEALSQEADRVAERKGEREREREGLGVLSEYVREVAPHFLYQRDIQIIYMYVAL